MRLLFKCLLTALSALLYVPISIPLRAQPAPFAAVPVPESTAFGTVTGITQDRHGFMWMSSNTGLHRYDGYHWTSYLNPHYPTNWNECVLVDREGLVWVGTYAKGLYQLDPATGTFTKIPLGGSSGADSAFVTALTEDRDGRIWAGTARGLYRLERKTGRAVHFRHDPKDPHSLSHDHVRAVYQDRQGTLWVGTGNPFDPSSPVGGLNRLDPRTGKFTRYLHDPGNPRSLAHNKVRAILEDSRGTFWVGTFGDGLHTMNRREGTFTRYATDTTRPEKLSRPFPFTALFVSLMGQPTLDGVSFIHEDATGSLWIGAYRSGLVRYDPQTGKVTRYDPDPGRAEALQEAGPWSACISREGMLWMSTLFGGLYRVDPAKKPFPHHQTGAPVLAVHQDAGGAHWLGTTRGLLRRDPGTGHVKRFVHTPGSPSGLSNDTVHALLEDRQGKLWIGTRNGLNHLDHVTGRFTRYGHDPAVPNSLAGNLVYALHEDRQGNIWVGLPQGLDRLDPRTGTFAHYPFPGGSARRPVRVTPLLEDARGAIWVGGWGSGIYRLDPQTGRFTHYLGETNVLSLYEDHRGELWAGVTGGLFRLDRPSGEFRRFISPNVGQWINHVKNMEEDDTHALWLSTRSGVIRLDESRSSITLYGTSYGVNGDELLAYASYLGPKGELFLGTQRGYFAFSPGHLTRNTRPPQLAFGDFRLAGKSVKPGPESPLREPLSEAKAITLRYDQNAFAFDFAGMHYAAPESNRHLFRLDGYDDAWRRAGSEKTASYANVPPGRYTFRVKAATPERVWVGKAIAVTILPPWWRTGWAYLGYGAVGIALLLGARRQIIRRERLQAGMRIKQVEADKLRELDTLKSRFFANLSHEFRTPLSLIRGTVQQLLGNDASAALRPDYQRIDRNAARLLQLVNQLLDLSKLEAGKMQVNRHPLEATHFLGRVAGSFASLAESKGITYRYYLTAQATWVEADADQLEKIVTNLLSNAFKFTPKGGSVILRATVEASAAGSGSLNITVEDTGIGIAAHQLPHLFERFYQADSSATRAYEGTGIGLALTKELVDLQGGTILVESTEGKGTLFAVQLPLRLLPAPEEQPVLPAQTDAGEEAASALPDHSPASTPTGKGTRQPETVLVVEDNDDLRQFLAQNLSDAYCVLQAGNGLNGYETAVAEVPDLVLSDLMMPGLDGLTLCTKLKADERTSHIPVILLTARADVESRLQGLEMGADDYLTKPFTLQELQLRVRNLIEGRRRLRELFSRQVNLQPAEIAVTSTDERFLQKVMAVIEAQLSNADLDVEMLSREIGMSRSNLHRKLTALTGQSANECIRTIRLKRAAHLLENQYGSVAEVAGQVGFNSLNYFAKCFREMYGQTPSEYLRRKTTADQQP